jgi:uncharacterized membrane protein
MDSIKTATNMPTPGSPRRWLVPATLYLVLAAGLLTAWNTYGDGIRVLFARADLHAPDLDLLLAQPAVLQIHVMAAVAAVILGAVLMTWRKGRAFHRVGGWVWVTAMAVVAGSSFFIVGLNGDRWSWIHILSGWTAITLPLAVIAARRHKVAQHRGAMMGLFYGGLLLAGLLNFIPGRLIWRVFLG